MTRPWGFDVLLVASGATELETTATSSAIQLIANEPLLASWSRSVSYRVVTRADVETLARTIKREELDAAETAAANVAASLAHDSSTEHLDGTNADLQHQHAMPPVNGHAHIDSRTDAASLTTSASSGSVHMSPSQALLETVTDLEVTPQIFANALQRLLLDDKTSFLAHTTASGEAASASSSSSIAATSDFSTVETASTTATSDSAGASNSIASLLTDFAVAQQPSTHGDSAAPTRIYLLHGYPSSLAEVVALLHTGEAFNSARHGDVPLLPLFDGALLVVDASNEQRKSVSQLRTTSDAMDGKDEEIVDTATATLPNLFETANALVAECFAASTSNSSNGDSLAWSDVVFADVPCAATVRESNGLTDFAIVLLQRAEALATHKYAFKRWVATTTMLPLPLADAASPAATAALATYTSIVDQVYEASVSVSVVLIAMREAVARTTDATDTSGPYDTAVSTRSNSHELYEAFLTHGDRAALRLAVAYATYVDEQAAAQTLLCAPPHNSTSSSDPCCVLGERIDAVEHRMWTTSDLPGVGNNGRKGLPIQPTLSTITRSVLDTELCHFVSMPVADVHLTQQLLAFEDLLGGGVWKGKLQSTRRFRQALDCIVLPQRLAQVLFDFPTVYRHYDAATDSLLLATLTATAPGRLQTTTWRATDAVRHRPAFRDWKREQVVAEDDAFATPRTLRAAGACVPLSSTDLAQLNETTTTLFPADQSVIRVYETPRCAPWLSVYQNGDVFGFRRIDASAPSDGSNSNTRGTSTLAFYASFVDDSQLLVRPCHTEQQRRKPDKFGTIAVTTTFANGLSVTANSDGTILQQYVSASCPSHDGDASSTSTSTEVARLIVGRGTVVRTFASGRRALLLANGDVYDWTNDKAAVGDEESLAGHTVRVVDPATNALVETRANGVVVITHTDGARATYHTDSTCMFTNVAQSHVRVTRAGFATVTVDIAVDAAAQRHARGERVAVTKGGLRARCVVDNYDGHRLTIAYNTKVIAQVNGRVTLSKPNGTVVVAKDSGRVEYQSTGSSASATALGEDADLDVTRHTGIYYFDCVRGRFEVCDSEQNAFCVDGMRSPALELPPRISVDLAGVVSDAAAAAHGVLPIPARAVVNDPIAPHLFVLQGDGTGVELLRPQDAAQYLHACADADADCSSSRREVTRSSAPSQPVAKQHARVFFETLESAFRGASALNSAVRTDDHALLHTELQRLAQPVNAAAAQLGHIYRVAPPVRPHVTIVRTLVEHVPLSAAALETLLASVAHWRAWQVAREATKDQFCVEDPRDADAIAQQAAVQRKVVAAYKATRARKRLEKQRARDAKRALATQQQQQDDPHNRIAAIKMETVHEQDEQPQHGAGAVSDSDDDGFGGLDGSSSDGSDAHGRDMCDTDVDDFDELLWTAFTAADTARSGRLSVAQTRQALVHALGVGVTTAEVVAALERLKLQDAQRQVGFDAFAELVSAFKRSNDDEDNNNNNNNSAFFTVPALSDWRRAAVAPPLVPASPRTSSTVAAGSATEAIRLRARVAAPSLPPVQ